MKNAKGFILAAGFGTRLKPLTDKVPKPLVPFLGVRLIDFALYQMQRSQLLSSLGVNTHYLGEQVQQHIAKQKIFPSRIILSHENEILGTGGFINPVRKWIGDSPLLIFNSDVVCDIAVDQLLQAHANSPGALATMALVPHQPGTTPVKCASGQVTGIGAGEGEPFTFSGIHVLSPEFIKSVPGTGSFSIIDTYQAYLRQGAKINVFKHAGMWLDLGDLRTFYNCTMDHLDKFSDIDQLMGISEIWQMQTSNLKFVAKSEGRVVGPSIVPRKMVSEKGNQVGPHAALYGEIDDSKSGVVRRCIGFTSKKDLRVSVVENGVAVDDIAHV
jgi:NDP-sugar pyrophosphorylase family protein